MISLFMDVFKQGIIILTMGDDERNQDFLSLNVIPSSMGLVLRWDGTKMKLYINGIGSKSVKKRTIFPHNFGRVWMMGMWSVISFCEAKAISGNSI